MSTRHLTLRERLAAYDVGALSLPEKLAVAVSRRPEDVEPALADVHRWLARFPNLQRLQHVSIADFAEFGLDPFEALQRLSMFQLGLESGKKGAGELVTADDPSQIAAHFGWLTKETKECFVVALLNSKLEITGHRMVSVGTLDMAVAMPREVFREAIREAAAAVILIHNHPSGDPAPSPEDVTVTRRMVEVGKLVGIEVVDHVIVGERGYESLRRRGYL